LGGEEGGAKKNSESKKTIGIVFWNIAGLKRKDSAAMAVFARRIVNAGSLIEFIDAIVAHPDHLSSV